MKNILLFFIYFILTSRICFSQFTLNEVKTDSGYVFQVIDSLSGKDLGVIHKSIPYYGDIVDTEVVDGTLFTLRETCGDIAKKGKMVYSININVYACSVNGIEVIEEFYNSFDEMKDIVGTDIFFEDNSIVFRYNYDSSIKKMLMCRLSKYRKGMFKDLCKAYVQLAKTKPYRERYDKSLDLQNWTPE